MINNYKKLKEVLTYERKLYKDNTKENLKQRIISSYKYETWKYIKLLRYTEYFKSKKDKILYKLLYLAFCRRKNIKGKKLGIDCHEECLGKGIQIFHTSGVVINGYAKIGENCKLHGNNCIGNNGIDSKCPRIGNNVDIGNGASIIGNITISDNIKIGAGAVVINSFKEEGVTIGGVPAKIIKFPTIDNTNINKDDNNE